MVGWFSDSVDVWLRVFITVKPGVEGCAVSNEPA